MKKIKIDSNSENSFISGWKSEDSDLFDKIIDFYENNSHLQSDGVSNFDSVNKDYKNTTDIKISPKDLEKENYAVFNDYIKHIHECYKEYRKEWTFFGSRINKINIGSFNLQKYDYGGHVKAWHTERDSIYLSHRVLAWITYLNDVEEDGETEFLYYNTKIKPEKGKTLIWPAEWTHAHRGNPTKNSLKYVVTGWFYFPNE